jgi:NADP-dependent 3-hydroxy acid dehydrogenase YdfG
MNYPLAQRTAIITGATAGIGRAIAVELGRLGAFVVANGRRQAMLTELSAELGGAGSVACVVGDCCDDAVITRVMDVGRYALGNPAHEADIVVVNAGRGLAGSAITSDMSQWEEMVRTNIIGAAKLIRVAGERMLAEMEAERLAGGGVFGETSKPRDIVVLGSTVGRHISPFSSMYGATKFAVNSLAEASRRELGPKGIRVTLIEPGFVESEFQGVAGYKPEWFAEVKGRIGPVLKPEDVARTIGFIVQQPAHVHVSDVLIRPTRQDYP